MAQNLTPYQEAILRELFIRGNTNVIEGSWLKAGTITYDKLSLPLPSGSYAESDPVFSLSSAFSITAAKIAAWDSAAGYGDWRPSSDDFDNRLDALEWREPYWDEAYAYYSTNHAAQTWFTGAYTNSSTIMTNVVQVFDGKITGVTYYGP